MQFAYLQLVMNALATSHGTTQEGSAPINNGTHIGSSPTNARRSSAYILGENEGASRLRAETFEVILLRFYFISLGILFQLTIVLSFCRPNLLCKSWLTK